MIPVRVTFPGTASTGIAAAQTFTAAAGGGFILNGTLAPVGNLTPSATTATKVSQFDRPVVLAGIARPLTITSTTSATNCVFTVVGLDLLGNVITATIVGASGGSGTASDTTATTNAVDFHIVTGVLTSGSCSAVSIGTSATGETNWFVCDTFKSSFNLTVGADLTATTTTYSVQQTWDNVQTATAPVTITNATISAISTTSLYAAVTQPTAAVRGIVTTNSATGGCVFQFVQSGGGNG